MAISEDKIWEYIGSFEAPAEYDFFNDKQKKQIESEKIKLERTLDYARTVRKNPELEIKMDKAAIQGDIFSLPQAANIRSKLLALERTGNRVDIVKSIVSPTGQRVILSRDALDSLGFVIDSYVTQEDWEDLLVALKHDGLLDDETARAKAALEKYGVIVTQRGIYTVLRPLLEEAVSMKIDLAKDREFEQVKSNFESQPHGASLEALEAAIKIPVPPKATPLENIPFAQELKREVETKELPGEPNTTKASKEINSKPPIPPIAKPDLGLAQMPEGLQKVTKPVQHTEVTLGLKSLNDIKAIDDLKKIQTEHLRQGELRGQVEMIKGKILSLAKSNKVLPYFTVSAFQQSPLYKTYLQIGAMMLNDNNPDRAAAYEAASKRVGGETLTLREFEAVADLRKQIEQL